MIEDNSIIVFNTVCPTAMKVRLIVHNIIPPQSYECAVLGHFKYDMGLVHRDDI